MDGAAEALINACLKDTNNGDTFLKFFLLQATQWHPELTAAYLVSAIGILKDRGAVFSPRDPQLREQIRELRGHIGHSDGREKQRLVKEANQAVNQLETMVGRPSA